MPPKCSFARVADDQVELPAADERARGRRRAPGSLDHPRAQRHRRAARQRLVGDAEGAGRSAGPPHDSSLPYRPRPYDETADWRSDVEAADLPPRRVDADAQPGAAALLRTEGEAEAAARAGGGAVDRRPALSGAALQQ